MFAGLMGLECHRKSQFHHSEVTEGGRASGTSGSSGHKRLHRRPGYMRGEQSRLQSRTYGQEQEEEEEEGRMSRIRNDKSRHPSDITDASSSQGRSLTPAVRVSLMNQQQPDKSTCSSWTSPVNCPLDCCAINGASSLWDQSSLLQTKFRLNPSPALQSSSQDSFNSSFSFIQQSLNTSQRTDSTTAMPVREPEPLNQSSKVPSSPQTKPATLLINASKHSNPIQSSPSSAPGSQAERENLFWQECQWGGTEAMSGLPDSDSRYVDVEITSSLSVDSDSASTSSVTSGYESATLTSDQGWDSLVKKYEGVLQDCLQSNRTHTKIESMMLKLQRLQQKAILDDDYDAAERFGKKLEELCRERGALLLGLPSRQPSVAQFLERLRQVVHSALQKADCSQRRERTEPDAGERSGSLQGLLHRRDHLLQEKRLVEEEIAELQQRLAQLKSRSQCLEQQIQQEEQQVEAEELEGSVLRSCTLAQLQDMSRTLQDLITSENRMQISVSPPPSMLRLQKREQALNLSIKEATAKVVMSQRLGRSLRRKVSETETQLLALHEAKLAAISGNDFSSAKELKAEMKAVYLEQDRLEALAKRSHSLSSGSSQELARMKEQRQQLRQELEQREARHESLLKENTAKYIELLEDRLRSCGCTGLERIWEADLEACHLFLRGLQLWTPSCSGADTEDLPNAIGYAPTQPCTKEEEEDCAMLTALGGRWCPEANLQNSEFTKDGCSEAADLTERCELISDRLMTLEDELQTAILNRDQALTQSLEREVQEVKATLQTMLAQLKEEEAEDEEVNESQDDDLMKNGTEEENEDENDEEEEDQYFSDSWDI
uniref:disrupted in schizophrenia 1 protein isoform X3 n=1 Tax=Monopterus albus TaxID=43700 RepID=UPI0009B49152|nr:disrupted in schizophrenia 1 protein isoform X3 [Monopterus albus]